MWALWLLGGVGYLSYLVAAYYYSPPRGWGHWRTRALPEPELAADHVSADHVSAASAVAYADHVGAAEAVAQCRLCGEMVGSAHWCRPLRSQVFTVQRVAFDALVAPPERHRSDLDGNGWSVVHSTVDGEGALLVWGTLIYTLPEQRKRNAP